MTRGNENSKITYRFLSKADFKPLHQTFLAAFADYFVPFQLSEEQFTNHLTRNSVELDLSVGAFSGQEMVGFTLNGCGIWNAQQTFYDAGTGVVPSFRRQGIGREMFGFMLPHLRELKIEQILLEVITKNEQAVRLYKQLGFKETRKLGFFKQKENNVFMPKKESSVEIREIGNPDQSLLQTFWDVSPSWQNSFEAIGKSLNPHVFLGAYFENECVGYIVADRPSATVAQLAVDKNHRRKGLASALLAEIQMRVGAEKNIRFSNVDYALKNAFAFLKSANFEKVLSQFEMIKPL